MFSRALRRVQAMTERDKLGLALLVLLWLVAGWWFFFHVPMRAAVEVMQEESAEAHAQLVDVENYRQQGQSIAAAEKAQKERHGFLMKALPSELGQGAFIGGLERLAMSKHLLLAGVQPGAAIARPAASSSCAAWRSRRARTAARFPPRSRFPSSRRGRADA